LLTQRGKGGGAGKESGGNSPLIKVTIITLRDFGGRQSIDGRLENFSKGPQKKNLGVVSIWKTEREGGLGNDQ